MQLARLAPDTEPIELFMFRLQAVPGESQEDSGARDTRELWE